MPAPPIVAITATTKLIDGMWRVRLNEAYVDALVGAGVVPLVLPPIADPVLAERALDGVSGLVLSGGEDVAPHHYGAAPHPTVSVHEDRDACELAVARAARARAMPTLAICRGIQVVNVAFGGTLVQDLPSERPSDVKHDRSVERTQRVHDVIVEPESELARVLGAERLRTNTSHHQAVDRVAPIFRVTAHSTDGVIEGIESTDPRWWMLGVQWHPEELVKTVEDWDRRLLRAFAERARAVQERGTISSRASSEPRPSPVA